MRTYVHVAIVCMYVCTKNTKCAYDQNIFPSEQLHNTVTLIRIIHYDPFEISRKSCELFWVTDFL